MQIGIARLLRIADFGLGQLDGAQVLPLPVLAVSVGEGEVRAVAMAHRGPVPPVLLVVVNCPTIGRDFAFVNEYEALPRPLNLGQ